MTLNRLTAASVQVALNAFLLPGLDTTGPVAAAVLYLAASALLAVDLLLRPAHAPVRRAVALGMDVAATSYEMHAGGGLTAWLYPAYLWVVFGNGFRFGPRPMLGAMSVCVAAFLGVTVTTPFWSDKPAVSAGLLLTLVLIPLYALTLIDKLSRARQEAIEASKAKSLFLAKVSHELRTPLTAIIGFGTLLRDGGLDPEQREMAQTILSSGRGLLSLIDSILDFSRVEAGRMPVSVVDFKLCDLMDELRRMVAAQAFEKRLSLALHVSTRTRPEMRGDARRLREILLNLLSNAVKFTQSGSIVLAVDIVRGAPDMGEDLPEGSPVRLRFEVDDTGIGIAPAAQSRIFDIFTQADETIAGRYGGTGLGLSITRQLVELLGGAMGVESQPGQGTLVWVELDMLAGASGAAAPADARDVRCLLAADTLGHAEPVAAALRALGARVESLPGVSAAWAEEPGAVFAVVRHGCAAPLPTYESLLASDALRFFDVAPGPEGAAVSRARRRRITTRVSHEPSGPELLSALRICNAFARDPGPAEPPAVLPGPGRDFLILVADDNRVNQKVMSRILEQAGYRVVLAGDGDEMLDLLETTGIDLVLADVNMPNLSGIEATQIFRVSHSGPHVPVIGVTADATSETRERCLGAGMDACILKPVEPAALVAMLSEFLEARAAVAPVGGPGADAPVENIAAHPRFRAVAAPVVDEGVLASLHALGGDGFLAEVVGDFFTETEGLRDALICATESVDAEAFRAAAHAVRSGASNLGARRLCEAAEPWETASAEDVRRHGRRHVLELTERIEELRHAFQTASGALRLRETRRL